MLHSFLVNDSEMTAGTTSEVSQSSVSKQGMLYYEDIQWFSQFSVVSLYFFFVLLLLCSLLLHYISKWNPCQATLTIEIIRGQKGFFDTCGFILSYFKFGDFITLLWKIQYISNDTHSKGWLIFSFKANGIVRSVEESSSDAECRENSSQKVHFVTSHISEI